MKIVVASDSFKGSCTTLEVASAIENGIRKINKNAEIIKIPVADGGEGTVEALVMGTGGRYEEEEVVGPLGNIIKAKYGIIKDNIAVIEMAAASGLPLLKKEELNPLVTTTYGTGQLIKSAIKKGCKTIFIGIGGSATNDGGIGMAQALGASFIDDKNNELGYGGGELSKLKAIDLSNMDPELIETEIVVMSDVTNPLCGESGASFIFGPQKGATPEIAQLLDNNLKHYASVIEKEFGLQVMGIPGAGAAGGLGAGLIAFCKASLHPGIEKVLDLMGLDKHLVGADLVITGEGRIDNQTIFGKVPVGVARRASRNNIPVVAIVGSLGDGFEDVYSCGIDAIFDIVSKPMTLEEAMGNATDLIEQTSESVIRVIHMKSSIHNIEYTKN